MGHISKSMIELGKSKKEVNVMRFMRSVGERIGYNEPTYHILSWLDQKPKIKGVYELYMKYHKIREDKRKQREEYWEKVKDIVEELKVDDIIIDDDETEWIVITKLISGNMEIKKRKGKMVKEIEYDGSSWNSVPDEDDEDKDGNIKDSFEPIEFTQML